MKHKEPAPKKCPHCGAELQTATVVEGPRRGQKRLACTRCPFIT